MSRLLVVRVVVTVLVVGLWVASLLAGLGGTFRFNGAAVAGNPYVGAIEPDAAYRLPLPPGLMQGDLLDQRALSVDDRVAMMGIPKVGSKVQLTLQRNEEKRTVTVVAVPIPPLRPFERAQIAVELLFAILGLALLWRGRDWTAWGLAMFALGWGTKDAVLAFPGAQGIAHAFAVMALRATRDLGLYVAARHLGGPTLPRRVASISLWTMLTAAVASGLARFVNYLGWIYTGRFTDALITAGSQLAVTGTVICVLTLASGYRHGDDSRRLRIRWILVAALLQASGWAISPVSEYPGAGKQLAIAVLSVSAAACYAYAVLRHKLVDLSFVISRTLVYGAVVALVVGMFAIIEHAVATKAMGEEAGLVLHLVVPLVLGVMLHQVRARIEHVVERLFFRRQFAAEQALRRLAHESAYMEQAERLVERTLGDIITHLRPARVAIYRRVDDGYVRSGQQGGPDWPLHVAADDPVFVALRSAPDEQDLTERASALGSSGMAFPMSMAGRLQGALVCGERTEHYTPDERRVLMRVAHDVGAALYSLKARENERLLDGLAQGTLSVQELRQQGTRLVQPPAVLERADADGFAVDAPDDAPPATA
ncbi:hypothetical protein J2X04_003012 [Lysobacter niabensis]|uniref:GAF domain-containing protein n=1 Tax=Agrilutibacter niabensis TaxID=380628 RepID=A0ABU1VT25_9GAMM|nr:GAF domain-containing protein [Lysobacter niabensis]MDR7100631.1 hypothetical protein [Lysobacter niabensis]